MADQKPIIPEGSVKIAGRDVEYSTIAVFGLGIVLGMIFKS